MKYKLTILLFHLFVFVCSAGKFKRYKMPLKKRQALHKFERRQLENINKIQTFKEKYQIENNSCFIHIPRTGGYGLRKALKKVGIRVNSWHSIFDQPPLSCGCFTNIRNPVDRYISEWKFYGMNWLGDKKGLFGWFPANGIPDSFDDYINDHSTHNSMTKILSGCQLFSNCDVDHHSVDKIIKRVKTNCLRILYTEDMPVQYHGAIYEHDDTSWKRKAESVNDVDVELYRRLKELIE